MKTMYDWFPRAENAYQDRADMFQFRLVYNVLWLNFLFLLHSITLLLVSGRRPMARKSITSSIVLKYPRLGFNFSLNYTCIDKSFPNRTSCWRSTGFRSEQYMSSTTMNPTLSTPMTGMRSISCRWTSFIQEGNDLIIR